MTPTPVCYKCGAPSTRGTGRHQVCDTHWQEYLANRCEKLVYNADRYTDRLCENPHKVVRDGKKFCGVHDPVRIEAKRNERFVTWEAASNARWELQARNQHRLNTWEMLLDALKRAQSYYWAQDDLDLARELGAIIAQADEGGRAEK